MRAYFSRKKDIDKVEQGKTMVIICHRHRLPLWDGFIKARRSPYSGKRLAGW